MRRLMLSAAAVAGLAASAPTASAQTNRNVIINSGNGVGNTITATNVPGIRLHAPPGAGYTPEPFQQDGYGPAYAAGYPQVPAPAQYSRNVIRDSGNGANNTIIARNGPLAPAGYGGYAQAEYRQPGYAPSAYQPAGYDLSGYPQAGYAPQFGGYALSGYRQVGYTPSAYQPAGYGLSGGYQQAGYAPGGFPYSGYGPQFGGFAPQPGGLIRGLLGARAGGFGPGGLLGGVNVNLISNSGNGAGNTIRAGNGRPGGLNFNIISNSGNGVGNVIGARNR